jgi:hypothetical protein
MCEIVDEKYQVRYEISQYHYKISFNNKYDYIPKAPEKYFFIGYEVKNEITTVFYRKLDEFIVKDNMIRVFQQLKYCGRTFDNKRIFLLYDIKNKANNRICRLEYKKEMQEREEKRRQKNLAKRDAKFMYILK